MILNRTDFLKDCNWKGRSQVSLTGLYLMERFGSVVFVLLPELWRAVWHFSTWDLGQRCHQSLLGNLKTNIKNIMRKDQPVIGRGLSPWPHLFASQAEDLSQGRKSSAKFVKRAGSLAVWSAEVWEALKETSQVCSAVRNALPLG